MILIYLKGLLTGTLFAFSFGPAFFANINTSISKGFLAGAMVVLGISLTDISYTYLAVFGLSDIFNNNDAQFYIALVGGLVILAFGVISIITPVKRVEQSENYQKRLYLHLLQGIAVNGLNPYVVVFWAGVVATTYIEMEFTQKEAAVFFAGVLTTTLLLDLTKAALASKIYDHLGSSRVQWFSKAVGVVFVIIGLGMISSTAF